METENSFSKKILNFFSLIFLGFSVLFLIIPFAFYPWSPSFVGTYSATSQLLHNGLLATTILSLFILISVFVVLTINFARKSDKSIRVMQIIGWTILAGLMTGGVSIFSIQILASLIKIPGGIKINFSDLEPLGFMIMVAFYSSVLSLVLLILGKITESKKHSVSLIIISIAFLTIGSLKIHQNSIAMESQYVLEQCQTLALGVVRDSGLTQIGQDLAKLGLNTDKSKMENILSNYGSRCRLQSSETFVMFREWLLSLSLSMKVNFESNYEIERNNFLDWINRK